MYKRMGYVKNTDKRLKNLPDMWEERKDSVVNLVESREGTRFFRYDVFFPGEDRVSFHILTPFFNDSPPFPLYRNGEMIDNAQSADEANKRLFHEARKYAYKNAFGRKVVVHTIKPAVYLEKITR